MSRIKTCYPMNQTRIDNALSQKKARSDKWRAMIRKVLKTQPSEFSLEQEARNRQIEECEKQHLLKWWAVDPRERLQQLLMEAELLTPKKHSRWDVTNEDDLEVLYAMKEIWLLCGCREWEKAFLRLQELNESTSLLPDYLYLNMWHWIDIRIE